MVPVQQIVGLSQEWSLLSPYTAFLVLESDQDYTTWGIDRRQRHRYWKPAEAQPPRPLPPEWTARAARQIFRQERESDQQRFQRLLGLARTAIEAGNPSLAGRMLDEVRRSLAAENSAEFAELSRQAAAGLRREALLRALGTYRPLLDPAYQPAPPVPEANLLPLVAAPAEVGPDFLRRHPYARQLLKEVKVISTVPSPEPKPGIMQRNVAGQVISTVPSPEPKPKPVPKTKPKPKAMAKPKENDPDRAALQEAILRRPHSRPGESIPLGFPAHPQQTP